MHNVINYFVHILLISTFNSCRSYNILVVFPMPGKSHATLGTSCVHLLLEAGHHVTYLKWGLDFIEPHQNLTVIDTSVPTPLASRYSLQKFMNDEVKLNNINEFRMIMSKMQRSILEHDEVQKLLHDHKQNFDIAILEWIYGEYIVGLPAIFGCPYVWFSTMEPHSAILDLVGETTNPAYTSVNNFKTIPPFNFMERVMSLKEQLSMYLYREFYINPIEERDYERVVAPLIAKRRSIETSYDELRYNASLVLGNSHISVGRPISLPEAYKAIGGYHVKKNIQQLPKDLQLLMDNSTNGVIYFSMGSVFNSADFSLETIEKLLKIFSEVKQTVLWKFEGDLPNRPSNVHLVSWALQQSILAHPNCILFISHGGLLSALETVHYGIPLIGIPVFIDQHMNVKTLVKKGMAKEVDLNKVADDLEAAIEDILSNSSHTQAARFQSFIYHHRPVLPSVEMVYWVEYVVRTNGAPHLRSVTLIVPWYQKCYLDLTALVIAILILLFKFLKQLLALRKSHQLHQGDLKKVQ